MAGKMPPGPEPHPSDMFDKAIYYDHEGRLILVGKCTRKGTSAILNIPISRDIHRRLREQVVGSLSMGSAALLEWALDELERRSISITARPND